ncbi:hypothetical protein FQA47_003155 [Oryzias melastigma]|uniref:WD repeat domain 93 n=1 Tax=Oryzias melastigma TaxID=30732 RepID=A0A834CG08_ORYME|nr:hypothetical protein FQA47_003155 [Oryzias melastigma]
MAAAWKPGESTIPTLELESVTQDPNVTESVDVKWSPVEVLIKITPPQLSAGQSQGGALGTDFFKHCLVVDEVRSSSSQSNSLDAGKTTQTTKSSRRCTHHFLLSCDPFSGKSLLSVLMSEADAAPIPDSLWPNANEIVCSAVSGCTRYIALGLDDALVCVWDRRTGAPLSIVSMPKYSSLLRMKYLDCWPELQTPAAEVLHLLVMSKSGELDMITAGRGTQTCTTQLSESSPPPAILYVCWTPNSKLCSYKVTWKPTAAILWKRTVQSRLFVFRFGQCCIIKQRIVSGPASSQRQNTESHGSPEEVCNLYLQQRLLSLDDRNKAREQMFERLHKTAQMIDQKQQKSNKLKKKK